MWHPKLTVLFLLSTQHVSLAQRKCYFPTGREATNNFPCNPDDETSPCCAGGVGAYCLSNQLCIAPAGNRVRGSCTSPIWPANGCPNFCTDLSVAPGGTDMISCEGETKDDRSFCCDHSSPTCCDSGVGRFLIEPSRPTTSAVWNEALKRFTLAVPVSSSTRSSTSATTSNSAASGSSSATSTVAPITSGPASSGSSNAGVNGQTQSGLDDSAKIGIGVGVGVGGLLLACLGYIIYKLRKSAAHVQHNSAPANDGWDQYHQKHCLGVASPPTHTSPGSNVVSELQPSNHHPTTWAPSSTYGGRNPNVSELS